MSYPKWKYHESLEPVVVQSEAEELELGAGWEESPAAFEKKDPAEQPKAPAKKSRKPKDGVEA